MESPNSVQHERQTVALDHATIEQCKAIIAACEARIEMVKRETQTQLRTNLRQLAQAAGLPLRAYLRQLLDVEEGKAQPEHKRTRRPSDAVAAEREQSAKVAKYYDPVSGTGWNGYGRAPRAFLDVETGGVNRRFLEACRNPSFQQWQRPGDAAE